MYKLLSILFMSVWCSHVSAQTSVSLGLPVIGAGSTNVLLSTSTTTNKYSKTISIYTAAEIIANGGSAGTITSIAWDKQGTGEYQFGDAEMTVYLKHVTNSNWATVPDYNVEVATATQVFASNTYSIPTGTGWKTVNFTTPFAWNGTDNIAVFVTWYRPGTPTAAINWGRSTAIDANATRVGSSAALVMLVNDNRPVVQFAFNAPLPCVAPGGITATGITQTNANIQWNVVAGATGYEYAVTTSATPPTTGNATTNVTYSATVLTASTTYYVHVRTQCGSSFSSWATVPFTTLNPAICPDPAPVSVSNIATTGANVSWTTVNGAAGYEYAITTNPQPPAGGNNISVATYNAGLLTPGTTYYIHVRTQCTGGAFSNWVTRQFTTLVPPCPQPAPAVTNITTGTADISWPAVVGAVGYEFSVNNSPVAPSVGANTLLTAQTIAGLGDNTPYYLHVRTNCGVGGFSAWRTVPFTTAAYCAPPTAIFSNITTTSADVNWNSILGSVSFEYVLSTDITPPLSGTKITGLNYNAKGLVHGTKYYMHMRSLCGPDVSTWSTAGFVTLTETGVDNLTNNNQVMVYPNPARDYVTIISAGEIKQVEIYNNVGVLVLKQVINDQKAVIKTQNLAPGIYQIRLQSIKGVFNQQLLIW